MDLLGTTREKSGSTGCEVGDYWNLYEEIIHRKPKIILECGSGISTVVFAFAARQLLRESNLHVKIISMEENKKYHDQIVEIFPDELRNFVEFKLSPRRTGQFRDLSFCFYGDIPKHAYDLVFVDGPTNKEEMADGSWVKIFNADFLHTLSWCQSPINAIIDQRVTTIYAMKRILEGVPIRYHPIKKLTTIRGATRQSIRRQFMPLLSCFEE